MRISSFISVIRYSLLLVSAFLFIEGSSQQLPLSSFYDMQGVMHNPATTGSLKQTLAGATYRTQWSSIPGAPKTAIVFAQTYLVKSKIGIGGYLYNDVTGPTSRTGLQLSYAYHIPLKNNSGFSVGLEGRFQQYSFDKTVLQASLGTNDPVIAGKEKRIKGDAGLGFAYNSPSLNAGFSVSQLIQSKLNLYEGSGNTTTEAKHYRHYYLHANYTFKADEEINIIPNALLIYLPNAPTELQTGVRVVHKDLLWYGLSWRLRQSWMISAGVKIAKQFTIGYSFDIYSSSLSIYNGGTNAQELLLKYSFKK